jgi:hypothetical protein
MSPVTPDPRSQPDRLSTKAANTNLQSFIIIAERLMCAHLRV